MSTEKCWKTPPRASFVYILVLIATVLTCGGAILNTPTNLADKETCKNARVDGFMTTTCICTGSNVQDLDLAGTNAPHINTNILKVEDCQSVKIVANVFARLQNLRRVELTNIRKIDIREHGFNWKLNESLILDTFLPSGIVVKIKDSVVPIIPGFAFTGIIESIFFTSTHIDTVGAYAFTNLQGMDMIEFTDVTFRNLEAQAFKKFSVKTLTLKGGNYGALLSRTMVDIEVTETLLIENISADLLKSSALIINSPETFTLRYCRFRHMEGEALRISVRGPTKIHDNIFESLDAGSFAGLSVEKSPFTTDKQQELMFSKNNITKFEPNALVFNTSRLNPTLDRVIIDQQCDCNKISDWTSQLVIYSPTVLSQLKNRDRLKKDASALWCRSDDNNKGVKPSSFQTLDAFNQKNCGIIKSKLNMILIISGCSLLVLIIIIVATICLCKRHRSNNQKWTNVPTSNSYEENRGRVSKKNNDQAADSRITMVVPDGRVYRETELHVIVEQAEPIYDDQHIYQNVSRPPAKTYKPVPLPRTSLRTDL